VRIWRWDIFRAHGFHTDKYDEAIKQLDAAVPVPRRTFVPLRTGVRRAIQVFDVWESQEDFDAFGRRSFQSSPNWESNWLSHR